MDSTSLDRPWLRRPGMFSVPRLGSVFLNGFPGIAPTGPVFDWRLPEFLKVFCSVPLSTMLLPASSESTLKGSSGESSSTLGENSRSAGEEGNVGEGENNLCGMQCWPSDVAECGEMIRTVLPVLVLVERGRSKVH